MSTLRDVITQLEALIPTYTGFDSKTIIPDPYNLESNPDRCMENSYGIVDVGGVPDPKDDNSLLDKYQNAEQADIAIVLVRTVYRLESDTTAINEAVKSMSDDINTLKFNLLKLDRIGIMEQGELIKFIGRSQIETVLSDKKRLVTSQAIFRFDLTQKIN